MTTPTYTSAMRHNSGYSFRVQVREDGAGGWEQRYLWEEPSPRNRPLVDPWHELPHPSFDPALEGFTLDESG